MSIFSPMTDTAYVIKISSLKTHVYIPANKYSVIIFFLIILNIFILQKGKKQKENAPDSQYKKT